MKNPSPPQVFLRFFRWFCRPDLEPYIEGDLVELYSERVGRTGKRRADIKFVIDVLLLFRPGIIRPADGYQNLNSYGMFKSYFKIGWRNLLRNKGYSLINIGGLALGMALAMLIGLWIYDELSFNKYHSNYGRIARVMQHQTFNGEIRSGAAVPPVIAEGIRNAYAGDFKYVVQSSMINNHILSAGEKVFTKTGSYCDPQITEMLSLKMLRGTRAGLNEPYSILLSESLAKVYFGDADPLDNTIKLDNKDDVKVTGVYEDLPYNSTFRNMTFILPWELFQIQNPWLKDAKNLWSDNFTLTYAQIADNADMEKVSAKIKDLIITRVDNDHVKNKPVVFLHPMARWHLYSEFKNGINTGGRIESVWFFGTIGVFVLFLACINFMNLSTARSEQRAKEVGIRKAIGSFRAQLVSQFFSESLLVAAFAFVCALLVVVLVLPPFNELAGKKISVQWSSALFWFSGIGFSIFTGMIAGLYPALYLSSFQPVKVLKGTFRAGRFASVPRKVLVVLQFTVSITLIVGTILVFKQIQFSKNRPAGYDRDGLVIIETATDDLHNHFNAVREDLLKSGTITEMAEASSPTTGVNNNRSGVEWNGKDPAMTDNFGNIRVTPGYGKTVGWQFLDGRDFSEQVLADSSAVIVNEAAVKYMGIKNPVGETIRFGQKEYTVIGVIKNMVMLSPYEPVKQTIFYIPKEGFGYVIIKLNPNRSTHEAMRKIEAVCKAYSPSAPFTYRFADDEYAKKFSNEERIGKLATFFAILAVFISCIGLFGMASFMTAQRTKEIGVRKILGASIISLWRMLSGEFVLLIVISLVISIPIAYYFMSNWLQKYEYRTDITWWVFAVSGAGALVIALLTISYQSVKAALANPVKSLRSE